MRKPNQTSNPPPSTDAIIQSLERTIAAGSGGAEAAPEVVDLMSTLQESLAKKKQGKREPWRCLYCGDVVLIKDNCRKPDCLAAIESARRRMGLKVDAEVSCG